MQNWYQNLAPGPSRGGGKGEVFPGPAMFGGPRRRSKILKMVFQVTSFWRKICIKSIFGECLSDPAGRAYDAPPGPSRMMRDSHPTFPPSRRLRRLSRHTERGVIGPRDNVFPGPAVALDGLVWHWLDNCALFQAIKWSVHDWNDDGYVFHRPILCNYCRNGCRVNIILSVILMFAFILAREIFFPDA